MATDIAAYSDSTLMNSHAESPSTMCVWGEIGYAGMTSGRHSATVRATACDPSSCSSMRVHLLADALEAGRRRRDIAVGEPPSETSPDGLRHGIQGDDRGEGGETAEQSGVRAHLADVRARDLTRCNGEQSLGAEPARPVTQP